MHPSTIEGYAGATAQNRRHAEARALAEIEADAGRRPPPLFAQIFEGEGAPGWYDIFALFVNEKIKTDERFRSIFVAAGLVDLKRLLVAMDRRIADALLRGVSRLDAKLDAIKDDTSVIRTMLEVLMRRLGASDAERAALQFEIERLRGAEALTAQTIAGFLRALGEQQVPPGDYASFLPRLAERYRALLTEEARRTNLPAAMEAERGHARDAIAAGDLDAADAILRRLEARLAATRQEQQAGWQQSCRDEARVKADRAALASTQLRFRDAAALFTEAAGLVKFDADAAWLHWQEAAGALADQGEEFGDNVALETAIATYGQALALVGRERAPLDWAGVQNNLGIALATLGARESGTARLEQAVVVFRAALEERTRHRVPLDWAATQNNLGNALWILGERESGTARLEQAVAAFRAALEERTRDRVPLDWAATQNNLGAALVTLGRREGDTARLEQAAAAYRAALEERTRDRVPLRWAATQNNLGAALVTLGEREGGTARLEQAVTAYRAALEERTRARLPFLWAQTMENLALTEDSLAERSGNVGQRRVALEACEAALEEYRRAGADFHIVKATRLRDHLQEKLGPD